MTGFELTTCLWHPWARYIYLIGLIAIASYGWVFGAMLGKWLYAFLKDWFTE